MPVTAAALLALTGCGGTAAGTDDAAEDAEATECHEVDLALAEELIDFPDVGFAAVDAAAVRSPNHEKVFLVAVDFGESVGVWAVNDLAPGQATGIFAVDHVAQLTEWIPAEQTDAAISPTDPSVTAARDCLAG